MRHPDLVGYLDPLLVGLQLHREIIAKLGLDLLYCGFKANTVLLFALGTGKVFAKALLITSSGCWSS